MAVADGMGGHKAGDVASRTAIEAFHRALTSDPVADDRAALENAFRAAADAVTRAAAAEGREGMGTTLVAAIVRGGQAWVAHAGDSRAVLVLPDGVVPLTEDHTVVNDALRASQITEEEARVHPFRHAVSRSLGEGPVEPDVKHVSRDFLGGAPSAVLLLGSDGLFNNVSETEILEVFARAPDLDAAPSARRRPRRGLVLLLVALLLAALAGLALVVRDAGRSPRPEPPRAAPSGGAR